MNNELLTEGRKLPLLEKSRTRFEVDREGDGPPKITGILSIADQVNQNSRLYSLEVWSKALTEAKKNLNRHPGLIDHPEGAASVADVGVKWTDFWITEDKRVMGSGELVLTRKGEDALKVIESGIEVGVSSRGYGSVSKKEINGEIVWVIQPDYTLESFDLVTDPSVMDARILTIESEEEIPWEAISLESLVEHRPDLCEAIKSSGEDEGEPQETTAPSSDAISEEEVPVKDDQMNEDENKEITEDVTEKVEETEEAPVVETTETPVVEETAPAEEVVEAVVVDEARVRIDELTARISELESEKASLAESVENYQAMLGAIAKQCAEDLGRMDFSTVGNLAWIGQEVNWMLNDEKYAAAVAAANGVESVLKKASHAAVMDYARDKARPEKFAVAIVDALADCATAAEVDAQFDSVKSRIESEMAGLPRPVTKGVVADAKPVAFKPESVEKATKLILGED